MEVIELSADEEEDDEEQGEGGRRLAASAGHGASDCGDDEVVVIGSQGDGCDASAAAAQPQPRQPRATQPPSLFAALAHAAAAGGRLSVAPRSCPVCAHSLGVTMTSAEVNAHVDACLRRGHR